MTSALGSAQADDVAFLDRSGLNALLRCNRAASLHGGSMQLCRISVAGSWLLAITGLAQLFVSEREIRELMAGGETATSDVRR